MLNISTSENREREIPELYPVLNLFSYAKD